MPFIFIIGLPGSGKTTLIDQIKDKYDDPIILDDQLNFGNLNEFKKLGLNKNVIISDPRLTNLKFFSFITRYINDIVDIYLFENNIDKCEHNIDYRCGLEGNLKIKLKNGNEEYKSILLKRDINNMSKSYNIDSYLSKYKNYNIRVLEIKDMLL